jgi:hypothetical protein
LQQIVPVQAHSGFSLCVLSQQIGKIHQSIFVIDVFIINKNNYIKLLVSCSLKTFCAMHKKLLHCSKDYEKICSTLNGLTQQRIQVIPLPTSVSSTLLHRSGFKRNPIRVAFFFDRRGADGAFRRKRWLSARREGSPALRKAGCVLDIRRAAMAEHETPTPVAG